nr:EOG090X01OH [Lepidurus arcticus]
MNVRDSEERDKFVGGVVEGFYGRPWTTDQRKDLFIKLKEWGLNSYVYAPKDDYKHRAYWRDLYTVEEADHLTTLIAAAKEQNVSFYYALSPGLDIAYSSPKDMATLKRKLDQVVQFGCTAFALLFDDIESEMSESDKEIFQSFAQAQVSVTNEIYQHLNQPKGFLFCPTQYCATRAIPDVRNSEYLNTIGTKLAPDIDILWTGPKVISRIISVSSIEELTEVLRRPPVIWDNLHANDYDQKRLFLGPYIGRSSSLISKLRGVVTNPNCEYGANFIAIHTLAQWTRCTSDADDRLSANAQLEQQGNCSIDASGPIHPTSYHPRNALRASVSLWLAEFSKQKTMWGPMTKPHVKITKECSSTPKILEILEILKILPSAQISSTVLPHEPLPTPNGSEIPSTSGSTASLEPMDINSSPLLSPDPRIMEESDEEIKEAKEIDVVMKPAEEETFPSAGGGELKKDCLLTVDDLLLLCDLFYLPFEHGPQGLELLHEFSWLKRNAHTLQNVRKQPSADCPNVREWRERVERFDAMSRSLNQLFTRLTYINNRELLYDLYPYVWDMRGVVSMLNSYVKWLASNPCKEEAFLSGEQEPWVFRGGLAADLQRLLPLESASDLFLYKSPDIPCRQVYTIRPYLASDEAQLYRICEQLHSSKIPSSLLEKNPQLLGDKLLGAFLALSTELCFVVEDDHGIVGYAVAAANAKQFLQRCQIAWVPELQRKYTHVLQNEFLKGFIEDLQKDRTEREVLYNQHPSQLNVALLSSVIDQSIAKRLVTCVVAALRSHGSSGCHVEVERQDAAAMEFYGKLGFVEIKIELGIAERSASYFGRVF